MGRAGVLLVKQSHDAVVEASKLATLFRSSIEPLPEQVTINNLPNTLVLERL